MEHDQRDLDLLAHWTGPGNDAEAETALLVRLAEAKQRLVLERLRVLARFIEARERGEAKPSEAADSLGLTVRSLHRLVVRLREMGAVAALAPTPGAGRKRRSDADTSLSKKVEDELFQEVFRYPHQPVSVLTAKMRELDPGVSASTIRRRAAAYRKSLELKEAARFGRAWLLDQAALRIPVAETQGRRWLTCAFLVDVDTGIICGRAPVEGQHDPGFGALMHALGRMGALLDTRLTFASRIEEVVWAVPDGWLAKGQAVVDGAAALRPPMRATVLMADKFRRGSKLSALLGGSVAGTDILIRATTDPRISDAGGASPHPDETSALKQLDADILLANLPMARWMKPLGVMKPPSRTRVTSLVRMMGRLIDFFEPALSEDQLAEARRLVASIEPHAGAAA